MLTGDNGILTQAARAKEETEKAKTNEQNTLTGYEQIINSSTGVTLETITGYETNNTVTQDSLGNRVVVPAGFKVVNPGDNVEDGIVIEDVSHEATAGSQFVWIPVGTIHTTSGDKTITLGRYIYEEDGTIDEKLSKTEPTDQLKLLSTSIVYYTEGLKESTTENTHARDISTFISKVKNETHGYYIGRYEARTTKQRTTEIDSLMQITLKPNDYVYNYVTQTQAAEISQKMYSDSNFESDLVNSYAWDTAILFLQECDDRDGENNTPYSRQKAINSQNFADRGTNNQTIKDVVCNVYDMASNCREWSTETNSGTSNPCVYRGGYCNDINYFTSNRGGSTMIFSNVAQSFRPIIYL